MFWTHLKVKFNLGFSIPLFESHFGIIVSIIWRASNHQIVDQKNYTKLSFKLFRSEIRLQTSPGLCKPSFANPAIILCFWVQALYAATSLICSHFPYIQLLSCALNTAKWSASCQLGFLNTKLIYVYYFYCHFVCILGPKWKLMSVNLGLPSKIECLINIL